MSGDGITPRVLVRIELDSDPPGRTAVRYEAQMVNSSIRGGNNYEKTILGFVEFPVGTRAPRTEDLAEFRRSVETKAEYVHWKPAVQEVEREDGVRRC